MKVNKTVRNGVMTLAVEGEINTLTTPELAKYTQDLSGIKELILDAGAVPYISSAGLRLLIACLRTVKAAGGDMLIKNCDEFVAEIFSSVGYDRIMRIETKNLAGETNAGAKQ